MWEAAPTRISSDASYLLSVEKWKEDSRNLSIVKKIEIKF